MRKFRKLDRIDWLSFLSVVFPQPQNKSGLSGLRTESPKKNEEQTLQNNVCEKLKKKLIFRGLSILPSDYG